MSSPPDDEPVPGDCDDFDWGDGGVEPARPPPPPPPPGESPFVAGLDRACYLIVAGLSLHGGLALVYPPLAHDAQPALLATLAVAAAAWVFDPITRGWR